MKKNTHTHTCTPTPTKPRCVWRVVLWVFRVSCVAVCELCGVACDVFCVCYGGCCMPRVMRYDVCYVFCVCGVSCVLICVW